MEKNYGLSLQTMNEKIIRIKKGKIDGVNTITLDVLRNNHWFEISIPKRDDILFSPKDFYRKFLDMYTRVCGEEELIRIAKEIWNKEITFEEASDIIDRHLSDEIPFLSSYEEQQKEFSK